MTIVPLTLKKCVTFFFRTSKKLVNYKKRTEKSPIKFWFSFCPVVRRKKKSCKKVNRQNIYCDKKITFLSKLRNKHFFSSKFHKTLVFLLLLFDLFLNCFTKMHFNFLWPTELHTKFFVLHKSIYSMPPCAAVSFYRYSVFIWSADCIFLKWFYELKNHFFSLRNCSFHWFLRKILKNWTFERQK